MKILLLALLTLAMPLVETYGRMEGTMWIPMSASAVMGLTKDRALFLQSLKDTISER